jgi:hypothetical protein
MNNRKTLQEAKIIARSSDPTWLGEELFRLQEQAADRDRLMEQNARFRMALEAIAITDSKSDYNAISAALSNAIRVATTAIVRARPDPTALEALEAVRNADNLMHAIQIAGTALVLLSPHVPSSTEQQPRPPVREPGLPAGGPAPVPAEPARPGSLRPDEQQPAGGRGDGLRMGGEGSGEGEVACGSDLVADATAAGGYTALCITCRIRHAIDYLDSTMCCSRCRQKRGLSPIAGEATKIIVRSSGVTSATRSRSDLAADRVAVQYPVMPTLDDIWNKLERIELRQNHHTALLGAIITGERIMALDLQTLQNALAQLNAATSQEATLLLAQNSKLDAVQATINNIIATPGLPQSVLDQVAQIQTTVAGMQTTSSEQASRLDQMAVDPRNVVPVAPPAA